MNKPIYLDFNATTPVHPAVLEAMLPFFGPVFGNPSSAHPYGFELRSAVENGRGQVANLIGPSPDIVQSSFVTGLFGVPECAWSH
jgi:cysteine desulfurase